MSDAEQSHEARPERSDVDQAIEQNVGGSSVGFERGDSMVNSYCHKEEQSKANFKENGSEHRSAYVTVVKNGRCRSNNSFSEGRVGATEGKRRSVNERLCVARQKESGKNASLASDSTISLQV